MMLLAKLGAPSVPGCVMDRRKLLLVPAISMAIASFQYTFVKGIAKAEFADSESFLVSSNIDLFSSKANKQSKELVTRSYLVIEISVPALRGKDYGKTKMRYPDYTETESGLQYKDLRVGDGPSPKKGETVVVDWDGYTIGYYGRIFEARNKTKGGSFEGGDKDFFKFKVGSGQVIPAFEEAISGMAPGGVRRIIVPPDLGYPDNDYNKLGPKPTTFSGQRALDFVLRNQGLIDKTLLFDIELLKIIPNQ
ncbi:Peptidyl-prolyl cis-trans isomerase [Zea mays]|uniref:peptidylprolyl isomerase n=2 Tax=Zea mays TaxID=4577 RepID=A0A1D6KNP4_MAIZE|nr:Peptidyl-prolyl cis-trans isomerase [Zea mays]